ncbi:hypothetical protein M8818_006535 [Zalaria obscura]|uniref:Uncharacterized protein n=1 Tax=Zalaria obscura TaxID=2024903 RepID=A0ACC3S6S4_9PEZI
MDLLKYFHVPEKVRQWPLLDAPQSKIDEKQSEVVSDTDTTGQPVVGILEIDHSAVLGPNNASAYREAPAVTGAARDEEVPHPAKVHAMESETNQHRTKSPVIHGQTDGVQNPPKARNTSSEPTAPKPAHNQNSKLCFFQYHKGECTGNPESRTYKATRKRCQHEHRIDATTAHLLVKRMPIGLVRWHGRVCCLPRCPYADSRATDTVQGNAVPAAPGTFARQSKKKVSIKAQKGKKRTRTEASGINQNPLSVPKRLDSPLRKRRSDEHPTQLNTEEPLVCFFWYHGSCARHRDRGCEYLHQMTNPPQMVQPPPGYVHRTPCRLPFCPGDYVWKEDAPLGSANKVLGASDTEITDQGLPNKKQRTWTRKRRDRDGDALATSSRYWKCADGELGYGSDDDERGELGKHDADAEGEDWFLHGFEEAVRNDEWSYGESKST